MNRQRILVGLLILVAVTMLPYYFIDQSGARVRKELKSLGSEMALYREKALRVRELEAQLAGKKKQVEGVETRLIGGKEPFAEMERELTSLASKAGVQFREIALQGPEPVKGLPTLVQYTASAELSGSTAGFLEFVRLLEQHRLLVEIPNLDLKLSQPPAPPGTVVKPGSPASPSTPSKPGTPASPSTPAKPGTPASPSTATPGAPVLVGPAAFPGAGASPSPVTDGMQPTGNGSTFAQATAPIQTKLVLHFYGKAPGSR